MMDIVLHFKSHTVRYHKIVKVLVLDDELRFVNDEDDEYFYRLNDDELNFIVIDKSR